jgi:hypothetical protein
MVEGTASRRFFVSVNRSFGRRQTSDWKGFFNRRFGCTFCPDLEVEGSALSAATSRNDGKKSELDY